MRNTGEVLHQLATALVGAGVLAWFIGISRGLWTSAEVMIALLLVFSVSRALQVRKSVVVGSHGIAMAMHGRRSRRGSRRAQSPWSIHRIDLYPTSENVRVWLRADALLPPGSRAASSIHRNPRSEGAGTARSRIWTRWPSRSLPARTRPRSRSAPCGDSRSGCSSVAVLAG